MLLSCCRPTTRAKGRSPTVTCTVGLLDCRYVDHRAVPGRRQLVIRTECTHPPVFCSSSRTREASSIPDRTVWQPMDHSAAACGALALKSPVTCGKVNSCRRNWRSPGRLSTRRSHSRGWRRGLVRLDQTQPPSLMVAIRRRDQHWTDNRATAINAASSPRVPRWYRALSLLLSH